MRQTTIQQLYSAGCFDSTSTTQLGWPSTRRRRPSPSMPSSV
nr:MAG TPA: hypothetical protein [Caudoviricetes sp.]